MHQTSAIIWSHIPWRNWLHQYMDRSGDCSSPTLDGTPTSIERDWSAHYHSIGNSTTCYWFSTPSLQLSPITSPQILSKDLATECMAFLSVYWGHNTFGTQVDPGHTTNTWCFPHGCYNESHTTFPSKSPETDECLQHLPASTISCRHIWWWWSWFLKAPCRAFSTMTGGALMTGPSNFVHQ